MLFKFFPSSSAPPRQQAHPAVKIVHAGGIAEYYHEAVPASQILGKYPSFILARPNVFRRPWDSLVGPDEMLAPGEKYLVVPRSTVRKLLRRIRQPDQSVADGSMSSNSFSISKHRAPSKVTTRRTARNNRPIKVGGDRLEAAAETITSKTKLVDSKATTNGSKVSSKPAGKTAKDGGSSGRRRRRGSSEAKASWKAASTTGERSGKMKGVPQGNRRVVQTSGMWSPSLPTISEVSPSS
ncbi:hypothetical protein ACLOJK_016005 [Asimina triloba]